MTEEQVRAAVQLWNSGTMLGEIARELGVGLYDVTFLTRAAMREIIRNPQHPEGDPIPLDADLVLASFT